MWQLNNIIRMPCPPIPHTGSRGHQISQRCCTSSPLLKFQEQLFCLEALSVTKVINALMHVATLQVFLYKPDSLSLLEMSVRMSFSPTISAISCSTWMRRICRYSLTAKYVWY